MSPGSSEACSEEHHEYLTVHERGGTSISRSGEEERMFGGGGEQLLVKPVRKSVMEEPARAPGGLTKLEERIGGLYLDLFPTSLKVQLLGEY